ncbi:MAG TPA: cupredoxin domain-containing protein [Caldimonas sp.]
MLKGVFAVAGAALVRVGTAQPAAEPRVIEMTARRFSYEPNEITLKAGERVVVAIRSLDFVHGMNIPDLGMRLDLVPGRVTRLELQPQAPGTIDFVCDNFCGDGHEEMHGRFVVSA